MVAWLVKKDRDCIFSKLDLVMQEVVKTVVWRGDAPLHPKEAEIEDATKIEIDWLVDIKELDAFRNDDRLVALDNTSVLS